MSRFLKDHDDVVDRRGRRFLKDHDDVVDRRGRLSVSIALIEEGQAPGHCRR
jgi:hypothetical protein